MRHYVCRGHGVSQDEVFLQDQFEERDWPPRSSRRYLTNLPRSDLHIPTLLNPIVLRLEILGGFTRITNWTRERDVASPHLSLQAEIHGTHRLFSISFGK